MFSNTNGIEIKRIVVPPFPENVYILSSDTTDECIVVDPGAEADRIAFEVNNLGKKILSLPISEEHTEKEINYVSKKIIQFYRK